MMLAKEYRGESFGERRKLSCQTFKKLASVINLDFSVVISQGQNLIKNAGSLEL